MSLTRASLLLFWNSRRARHGFLALTVGFFLVFVRLALLSLPVVSPAGQIRLGDEPVFPVTLPWSKDVPPKSRFTATLSVTNARLGAGRIRIVPDDCVKDLRYGDRPLTVPKRGSCDIHAGFSVSLPDLPGEHPLKVEIFNDIREGAIDVVTELNVAGYLSVAGALICFLYVMNRAAAAKAWSRPYRAALLLGTAARVLYLIPTGWRARAMDYQGHWEYVTFLLKHHTLPKSADCWECYHPPFYYLTSAVVSRLALVSPISPQRILQGFSVLCAVGFLIFGLLAVRRLTEGSRFAWLSAFVFALWPATIVQSPILGNDALLHLFSAATFYGLACYWQSRSHRWILASCGFGGLAMLSKYNGALVLMAIPAVVFTALWVERRTVPRRPALIGAGVSMGASLFVVGTNVLLEYLRRRWTQEGGVLGTNSGALNDALRVQAEPYNYLWFDLESWFKYPFTNVWDDSHGRAWFWNFLGKSCLFGEHHISHDPFFVWIAAILSGLLLVIVAVVVRALLLAQRRDIPWMVPGAVLLAGAIAFRIRYPFACSGDFRYILCSTIAITAALAWGLEDWTPRSHLKSFVILCIGAFAALSFLFYSTLILV